MRGKVKTMKINRTAKKYDLNQISKAVVNGIKSAAESARAEAKKIQEDERYTDAYKRQLIQEVAIQYETTVQGIRKQYAPKIDELLQEIHESAEHIQPRQIDDQCLKTLQMLQTAPKVTEEMIQSAAQSIGGDQLAIQILREFAANADIHTPIQLAAPPKPYLTVDHVHEMTNSIATDFRNLFDAFAHYDSGEPVSYHDDPEGALNYTIKPQYMKRVEHYANELIENPFTFGNEALDAQFAAECCN